MEAAYVRNRTRGRFHPLKIQISLRIRAVLLESDYTVRI